VRIRDRGIINYLSVLVAAAFLPAVVLAVAVFVVVLEREIDVAWSRIEARTTFITGSVDSQMDALAGTLDALSSNQSLIDGDFESFHHQAQAVTGDRVDAVSLIRPDGVTILNSRVPIGTTPPAFSVPESAVAKALSDGTSIVSDLFLGATSRRPIFAMIKPVRVAGQPMALAVGLFAQRFAPLVARTLPPWEAAILDGGAQDVARFPTESSLDQPSRRQLAELIAKQGRGHAKLRTTDGGELFVAYERSAKSGWGAVSSLPRTAVVAPIQRLILGYAIGAAILVVPGIVLAALLGLRLVRSLRELARFTGMMAEENPERLAPVARLACREITVVADGLDQAAADIAARDLQLRGQRDLAESRADEIHRQSKELAASNAELQQFAYVASHDLREPLRMISSYIAILERRYGDSFDADAKDFIGFVVDGAQRMDRMVQDLLDYSRIGRVGANHAPVPLRDTVDSALAALRLVVEESGAAISVAPDLPIVNGARGELVRLFQNLIGNALKYRHADRAPVIGITWRPLDHGWQFSVSDNGIGIAPEYFERVFAIFQRLHTREKYEGTGIGLAICKKIVEHHGGRIWVESVPDQGSTFHFTLQEGAAGG